MTQHAELIERLRDSAATGLDSEAAGQAADALEAQARQITEMQQQESELCTLHAMAEAECKRLRTEIEALRKDAERLEYVYSSNQTTSNALVELEFRLLNGESPSMSEVRAAIDAAKGEPHGIPPTT
jgi:chromosome segregation ATPase